MTVPSAYAVTIYVNDVDVTAYAPYQSLKMESYRKQPSKLKLTLEDPTFVPEKDMEVFVFNPDIADAPTAFLGYIVDVKERKRDNGIVLDYELECADRKIRLLKAIVAYGSYTGLDTDILDDLLANAFPVLSSIYDFSNAVNLASGLDLPVNDDSLLDLLDKLSDQAGADWSFTPAGTPDPAIITFDSGGWGSELSALADGLGYHIYNGAAPALVGAVAAVGNPGNCVRWQDANNGTISSGNTACLLEVNLGGNYRVTQLSFDYYVSGTSNVQLRESVTGQTQAIAGTGAWYSHSFTLNDNTQFPKIGFQATADLVLNAIVLDLRFDNFSITTTTAIAQTNPKDELVWDSSPPASAFDLNISSSNEYAKNIDLDIGGWDDYNAVIVTGASELVAVDWTYVGNQYQEHYPLETQIKDIVVYKNTGSDASPTWGSALTLGYWGVDAVGSKDVLYDEGNHWLLFNVALSNLNRAFRVTGSIKRPIRVLVGDYPTGAVVYATTIYDANATTPEAAANIGFGFLNDQNAIRRLNFETMHPGLKVGQAISVTDTARGLSEVDTVIQKITTTWIGASGHANFEVECGIDESNDASSFIAENDKRSREKAVPVPIGTTNFEKLYNSDGSILYNSDGSMMFQRV